MSGPHRLTGLVTNTSVDLNRSTWVNSVKKKTVPLDHRWHKGRWSLDLDMGLSGASTHTENFEEKNCDADLVLSCE